VAIVKHRQDRSIHSATHRTHGQTLFESFPGAEVASIEIQGAADHAVTLTKKDKGWVVTQRGDYPANNTYVNDFLRTMGDLKITQGLEAGPSFAPRFGMDEAATIPAEHGIIVTFKNAAGNQVAKVALGKTIENEASHSPMRMGGGAVGRYIRNYADESGFYAVNEMFPAVSAEPKRWLADGFISPENIKTVAVTKPGKEDLEWKVARESETAEFHLENAAPGEVLDSTEATALKSLFSYARFDDVVPADKVAERKLSDDSKRTASIQTVEGFVYVITMIPIKPVVKKNSENHEGEPPASDNFLMTVDVSATLPADRKKEDGEKPEDAKTKDAAFTERHKALTEKLEKEKALSGITFEVAKSTVEALLKDRTAILAKAAPPANAGNGAVQQLPGGMIARPPVTATTPPVEAVTPPVEVPVGDQ
jgi:hypothetical protein